MTLPQETGTEKYLFLLKLFLEFFSDIQFMVILMCSMKGQKLISMLVTHATFLLLETMT